MRIMWYLRTSKTSHLNVNWPYVERPVINASSCKHSVSVMHKHNFQWIFILVVINYRSVVTHSGKYGS